MTLFLRRGFDRRLSVRTLISTCLLLLACAGCNRQQSSVTERALSTGRPVTATLADGGELVVRMWIFSPSKFLEQRAADLQKSDWAIVAFQGDPKILVSPLLTNESKWISLSRVGNLDMVQVIESPKTTEAAEIYSFAEQAVEWLNRNVASATVASAINESEYLDSTGSITQKDILKAIGPEFFPAQH